MTRCALFDSPDIELYFYGELDAADRMRVDAHLHVCEACRQRLEDLRAIRCALAARQVIDAPDASDWSGFMRRLDAAVARERLAHSAPVARGRSARSAAGLRYALAIAAMLTIVALGVSVAVRVRHTAPSSRHAAADVILPAPSAGPDLALREVSAEHLERSKLVVLGLATLDPKESRAADWQYERQLAGTLLDDTRIYRQAAQEHGLNDVAHVMRDLETVLIETSMSDSSDKDALARVQRLIAKRDLVVRMQLVGTN